MRNPRSAFNAGVSEIDEVGVPTVIPVGLNAAASATIMYRIQPGQCFLIQRIVGQCDITTVSGGFPPNDPSPVLVTPTFDEELGSYAGIAIVSGHEAADVTESSIAFRPFMRAASVFLAGGSPAWQNAAPLSVVNWKLRHPICIPSGWRMSSSNLSDAGGNWAVYGRLVSEAAAKSMGFDTGPSTDDTVRRSGVTSFMTTSSAEIIVPARAGHSIQILDCHFRLQPVAAVLTSSTMTIEQGDARPIFVFANNNPGDMREWVFAPEIYLKPGESLRVKSSTALTGSGVISWRYVPEADVPGDHFWACVEPGLPTPATTQVGAAELARAFSHEITCFYPRRNVTKTSPTKGFQHLLRGYLVTIQKDVTPTATDDTDWLLMRISTGSAGSLIGYSTLLSITDTGTPLTPIFSGTTHDQNFTIVVDDVNMPGKQDDGSLWIDQLAIGRIVISTPSAVVDVDEFWVTVWGKTIPNQFTSPVNRGTAD